MTGDWGDEDTKRQLAKVFVMVDKWRERTHAEPTQAAPGSSLHADDVATAPYQMSHMVGGALLSAVDHLDAFRALVVNAQVIHSRAPYTLLRAALENAAVGVWLLAPSSRNERVLRRLRLQWVDSRDGERVQALFGTTPSVSKEEWKAKLEAMAAARDMTTEQVASITRAKPTFSSIVQTAGDEGRDLLGRDALFLWMLASGIAHVRMTAVLSQFLDRVELPGSSGDVVNVELTASDNGVTLMATVAALMLFEGWRLLDERATNHLK